MKYKFIIFFLILFSCELFIGCVSTSPVDYAKYGFTQKEILDVYGSDIFFHIKSGGLLFAGSEPKYMAKKAAELGKHYFYILDGNGKYERGAYHSTTTFNSHIAKTTTYQDILYSGNYDFAISNVYMQGANSVAHYGLKPSKRIPKWIDDTALKNGIEQFSYDYHIIYINDYIDRDNGSYLFEAVANRYNFLGCIDFTECNALITVFNHRVQKIVFSNSKLIDENIIISGGCILKKELNYSDPAKESIEKILGY